MKLIAFLLGLALAQLAYATAPTLTGNNFTSADSDSATPAIFVSNIGSPSANELDVDIVSCNDVSTAVTPIIATPSGWTQETIRNGTNSSQAVLWKIASGSEGSTMNVSLTNGGGVNECASWYFKFTGYNASNPIDCTDIAWAGASTIDPPDQTVTGGPLDVYVIAEANSRGDEDYASGSDLTTNAHADGPSTGTIDLSHGRSIAVSYGAYSAISSKNPGAFVLGGANRFSTAVTCVIYPASTNINRPLTGPLGGPMSRGPAT